MSTEGEEDADKIHEYREVSPCAGVVSGQLGLPSLLAARPHVHTEGEKEAGKIQADREVSPCAGEGQVY